MIALVKRDGMEEAKILNHFKELLKQFLRDAGRDLDVELQAGVQEAEDYVNMLEEQKKIIQTEYTMKLREMERIQNQQEEYIKECLEESETTILQFEELRLKLEAANKKIKELESENHKLRVENIKLSAGHSNLLANILQTVDGDKDGLAKDDTKRFLDSDHRLKRQPIGRGQPASRIASKSQSGGKGGQAASKPRFKL
jgi:chromosome segregation ATPase